MYFISITKKGVSASELQRQLGHKRYEPIFVFMSSFSFNSTKSLHRPKIPFSLFYLIFEAVNDRVYSCIVH